MPTMSITYIYRIPRYLLRKLTEAYRSVLWKYELTRQIRANKDALRALANKHKNQPCVIIGGGPSINKMDLAALKSFVTIGCNAFYLKHDEIGFVPTYYTVEDPLPAEDNKKEISEIKNTVRIIPWDLKGIIKSDSGTIYSNFRRSKVSYRSKHFPLYSHDFLEESFWGGTVLYYNIQLAEYLGCNPIYLIGVDLSYKVPDSVIQKGAVLMSTEDDANHFDPKYFGAGKRWHLPETERMQLAFDAALAELKNVDIELFNSTVGGNLQNVPRKEL